MSWNLRGCVHHILIECPSLHPIRENLRNFTRNFLQKQPDYIQQLMLIQCSEENPFFSQFLLDCSVDVDVIKIVQEFGADALRPMFLVTRTWVYLLHRHRLKLLGLWRLAPHDRLMWRRPLSSVTHEICPSASDLEVYIGHHKIDWNWHLHVL